MYNKTNVRELVLYATNDGDLYRRQAQPIMQNMARKILAGKYDAKLAVKAWRYFTDAAAKKYGKEFGSGDGFKIFSPADREQAAKEMVDQYAEEIQSIVQAARRKNPSAVRNSTKIVLPSEVVTALFEWHGGQFTPTYSLASTGMNHTVTSEMIDKALGELRGVSRTVKPRSKEKRHLTNLIGELETIRQFPEEFEYEG